ncbi:hypothetical protein [Anaerobutyricum hallii]|uniref:hypothetical protein n=1 Tax=Anaerobutyricum hallii TaxID=39488 RepID=UPI003522E8BE
MASTRILLYRTIFECEYSITEIVDRLESDMLDGTKMVIEDFDNMSLSGMYIYSELYKAQEYNFQTNIFETRLQKRYVVTEFHWDITENYMDIWGNAKNAQKIITAISLAFDNKIIVEALKLKFDKLIEFLSKQDNICVDKVIAKQVVLDDGLLADCSLDLSTQIKPFEIISRYKNNIKRIGFKWKCIDSDIKMVIYMSGAITIYKKQYLIESDELKQIHRMLLYAGR